jgi:hypothetical protein
MRPARFVTWCFVYSGAVLLAGWAVGYGLQVSLESLAQLGVALAIGATGVHRLLRPDVEADNPGEYGPFAYGVAVLAILLTVLLVLRVMVA